MSRVLVIGDGCSDIFRYGICERISPEAPVPIFLPTKTIGNGGMAINVYENVKALGVDCDIITNDLRPVKTRYVDEISNQILLRVDEKDTVYPIDLNILHNIDFKKYDAIIISDYNKGYLNEDDIKYIAERHDVVFLDSKKKFGSWVSAINFVKINHKEYVENWTSEFDFGGDLIVTKGKEGAILNSEQKFLITNEHEVRDLSGAGDTFLAALVVKYLEDKGYSSRIAN